MNELQLIKSGNFNGVQADFYGNGKEIFMTANQLGECLEYSNPRESINKLVSRNEYLRQPEFSSEVKMTSEQGIKRNTRVFTEDGIYEVAFKANTNKALEFREWVRKLLKSLRRGETKIVGMSEYQKMLMNTRSENAKIRKAQILTRLAEQYDGTFKQVLQSHATKELTGEHLLPLPVLGQRTYTATELGEMLGVSSKKIGILTNQHNLKTKEYGQWFNDKAKGHNKEVSTFRYYDSVIPVLKNLLAESA